jgi:uncharacterized protein (TIGR02594 family)
MGAEMKTDRRQIKACEIAGQMIGLSEIKGTKHNPEIVKFFAEAGHSWVKDDETAWCAALMGAVLKRAGLQGTGKLNARSYLEWGNPVDIGSAKAGDIVVFWRGSRDGWQGHVGFYVATKGDNIIVRGGNQGNKISEAAYPASRLLGVRRMTVADVQVTPPATSGIIAALVAFIKGLLK